MFGNEKKKLIVVVDKKTVTYGELLSAFVTMKDDKYNEEGQLLENGIVGIRDGSVDVVVWDEKTYVHNQPELSSSNKIVFIGNAKFIKPIKANINMECELSKFGIDYGCFGNKAVICVSSKEVTKNRDLYYEFIESYVNFISTVGEDYTDSQKVVKTIHIADYDDERNGTRKTIINAPIKLMNRILKKRGKKADSSDAGVADESEKTGLIPEASDKVAKGFGIAGHIIRIAIPYFWPAEAIEVVGHGVLKSLYDKDIIDQQYRYGILAFYMNILAKFLD